MTSVEKRDAVVKQGQPMKSWRVRLRSGRYALLIGVLALALDLVALPLGSITASAWTDSNCYASPSNYTCNNVPVFLCSQDAYIVNEQVIIDKIPGTNIYVGTQLMYSPHCRSNFAMSFVDSWDPYATSENFGNKIRRASGPDGGYLMYASNWVSETEMTGMNNTLYSPLVYSPDNSAQACFRIPVNDNFHCTAWV
jgi:hypothetical protein